MVSQTFNIQIQAEGQYIGNRLWTGPLMHQGWNVANLHPTASSLWGVTNDNWLQYRSAHNFYSIRYNALDTILTDYFFETVMNAGGEGKYEIGVAFRFRNTTSFYFVVINGGYQDWGGKNIRLMKRSGSNNIKLAEATFPTFTRNKDYKIRVELNGPRIVVKVDDVIIFDYIDSSPILSGAFGPIVLGQEFARWKEFSSKSVSAFILKKDIPSFEIESYYNSPQNSKIITPMTIGEFMQNEIENYMKNIVFDNYWINRYIAISSNSKYQLIFDREPGKNITTEGSSRLYGYRVPPTTPPSPPQNLKGKVLGNDSIQLTWEHSDDLEDGFHILDEQNNIIGTVGPDITKFIETGLTPGTTVRRKIVAYNTMGWSNESNEVILTTLELVPNTPENFKGRALSDKAIEWTWDDVSDNEAYFEIVNIDEDGNINVIQVLEKNTTKWVETNLQQLTTYKRAVRAVNSGGRSELSNIAEVQTLKEVPPPPSKAPINFHGVGVAHDKILWTWEDFNKNATGYYIFDELDQIVGDIPSGTFYWTEANLASSMEYRRKIAAYNEGGIGPKTDFVWAKTLAYGYDKEGTPLEPFNLKVVDVTEEAATLEWEYNEHPLLVAIGFKIYNELDENIAVIPKEYRSFKLEHLVPNTSYTVYLVAYNEVGDSLPSNTISFVTKQRKGELPPPDDTDYLEEWDNPYNQVEYDVESEDTPKIPAFHSGVGDGQDLIVKNLQLGKGYEDFQYEMYIKGYYEKENIYYPKLPFKFKCKINTVDFNGKPYTKETDWQHGQIQGSENGPIIRFNSVIDFGPLPDDIVISPNIFSVELQDKNGKDVPPYSPGSKEPIKWVLEIKEQFEYVGFTEEIQMDDVFYNWKKFSHSGTSQPANVNEMNGWIYDEQTKEIITLTNSNTFIGAISPNYYNKYEFETTVRANNNDNDRMGVILAFAIDENGKEHTLSALRNHEQSWHWAIWYNYRQSNAVMLASMNLSALGETTLNWKNYYPNGSRIKAIRDEDYFEVYCSIAGTNNILQETKLTIDLNDYPYLSIFKGPKQIGVCAQSQERTALSVQSFKGDKTITRAQVRLVVWADDYFETYTTYEPWIGAATVSEKIRIYENEEKEIIGRIQALTYQIPWQEASKKYKFVPNMYQLVVTSKNPNVKLTLENEIRDFFPRDSTFIRVPLKAKIINHTQTAWSPGIHNGYYYLNQREYYLFSDNRVLPKDDGNTEAYMYYFPYIIRAYGERYYDGGDSYLTDQSLDEFSMAQMQNGIHYIPSEGITLENTASEASIISRILDFGHPVEEWKEPILVQNEQAIADGASVVIEIGECDDNGNVLEWKSIEEMHPARKVRYRATLKEGFKKDLYEGYFDITPSIMLESYLSNVSVDNGIIQISDPNYYAEGTFVSKPIDFGEYIEEMGYVEITMEEPNDSSIELYSVSAQNQNHHFHIPTSTEPWIPLQLVSSQNGKRIYEIQSKQNPYVSIVAKLKRGEKTVITTNIQFNKDTFVPEFSQNMQIKDGTIQLIDSSKEGIYESHSINMNVFENWDELESVIYKQHHDVVDIQILTADTKEQLEQLAKHHANWISITNNRISAPVRPWMKYRIRMIAGDSKNSPMIENIHIKPIRRIGVTPVIKQIELKPKLYYLNRVVPKISSISIGGYIPKGSWIEEYTIPMSGEVIADQAWHKITGESVEQIVLKYLSSMGISHINDIVFKDYVIQWDTSLPIELKIDYAGKYPVEAKTTSIVGDIIYMQEKIKFDKDTKSVVVRPIPQQGSPIIIKNAQGIHLRQVHFRDQTGKPTLINTEYIKTDGTRILFLEHRAYEIDLRTLRVYLDLAGNQQWTQIYGSIIEENRLILPFNVQPGVQVQVLYALKHSFCVDYNYAPNKDHALIKVHTTFDPDIDESMVLDIKYEVNKKHSYYIAEEIDLNPLRNKINDGFIYLTDEWYEPYKLKLMANPNKLFVTRKERITVHAYVYDIYDNPVVGENILFESTNGKIFVQNNITDMNGMATAIFEAPDTINSNTAVIRASVLGNRTSPFLQQEIEIEYIEDVFHEKIAIIPQKHIVQNEDVVQLKVIVIGPNNERLSNREVKLTSSQGNIIPSSGQTDYKGELSVTYHHPKNPKDDYVLIEAKIYNQKEQILLGTSGV